MELFKVWHMNCMKRQRITILYGISMLRFTMFTRELTLLLLIIDQFTSGQVPLHGNTFVSLSTLTKVLHSNTFAIFFAC